MIEQITEHIQELKDLLPAFQKQSNIVFNHAVFMGIIGKYIQEIEDLFFLILVQKILATATGINLEYLGQLVGRPRPLTGTASTDDNAYRALIYAKIAANTSQSTRPDIIAILKILGENLPKIKDLYPATLKVEYAKSKIPNTFLTVADVKNILRGAVAPINLEVSRYTDTPFGFADDANASGFDVGELSEGVTT